MMNYNNLADALRAMQDARRNLNWCRENGTAPRDVRVGFDGGSVSLAKLARYLGMKPKNNGSFYE